MANTTVKETSYRDDASDYGSDFTADEEEILNGILSQLPQSSRASKRIQDYIVPSIENDETLSTTRATRVLGRAKWTKAGSPCLRTSSDRETPSVTIEVEQVERRYAPDESEESRDSRRATSLEPTPEPTSGPDRRSPLERFRTAPKKTLSVTDLISPSWCELQYWYSLTRHGKKLRTPAMKAGTLVHKNLEDQIHNTVAIDIETKEDAWGLRLWNVIQGLKTLRETGMTRELEVWGVVDGQVINGVIDELSYICPDRNLEAEVLLDKGLPAPLPSDQHPITDFLSSPGGHSTSEATSGYDHRAQRTASKIYLTDVKTRSSASLPKGASFRPTRMQLMLYQNLLSGLATNSIDVSVIFSRYNLQPDTRFTDAFIAQVGGLNEIFYDAPDHPLDSPHTSPDSTQGSLDLLLDHSTLRSLWELMMEHFVLTFPRGRESIGNVLKVEYRSSSDGRVRGAVPFLYDSEEIERYVADEMKWWKGEREARGVVIEEAYKCGLCEFAGDCDWRKNKVEEGIQKIKLRKELAKTSSRSRV